MFDIHYPGSTGVFPLRYQTLVAPRTLGYTRSVHPHLHLLGEEVREPEELVAGADGYDLTETRYLAPDTIRALMQRLRLEGRFYLRLWPESQPHALLRRLFAAHLRQVAEVEPDLWIVERSRGG